LSDQVPKLCKFFVGQHNLILPDEVLKINGQAIRTSPLKRRVFEQFSSRYGPSQKPTADQIAVVYPQSPIPRLSGQKPRNLYFAPMCHKNPMLKYRQSSICLIHLLVSPQAVLLAPSAQSLSGTNYVSACCARP